MPLAEVLRDRSAGWDIRKYLEAENDYPESLLGHTPLANSLVKKCAAASRKTIPPCRRRRAVSPICASFRDGVSRLFGRVPRSGGEATIILDGDACGGPCILQFGGARHSPEHRLEACERGVKGSEDFSISRARLADGKDSPDLVGRPTAGAVWSADSKPLLRQADEITADAVWRIAGHAAGG